MDPTESNPSRHGTSRDRWRVATIFCLLLLVLTITAGVSMYEQFTAQIHDLQKKLQQTAQLQYVAVLVDERGEPAILLTQISGESSLQLQRLNDVVEGGEDTMQLWALSAGAPARSLGVLSAKLKTLRLPVSEQALVGVPKLGISVENKGGVTNGQGPRLPYLFTGTVIRKAL
jgi:anti-sigma-K factor RskA